MKFEHNILTQTKLKKLHQRKMQFIEFFVIKLVKKSFT